MVFIFFCTSCVQLNNEYFEYLLKQLPVPLQSQILKFRKWEDQQRSLFGKILLMRGLTSIGGKSYLLRDLKYTRYLKPYFDEPIEFNISHSGEYVICAISDTNKIGIDIEEIRDIAFDDFNGFFAESEWQKIMKAGDSLRSFYSLWTQKEAFIKAIGTGLNTSLTEVIVTDNKIDWAGKRWFLHEITLDTRYVAHLSADIPLPEMIVTKIDF